MKRAIVSAGLAALVLVVAGCGGSGVAKTDPDMLAVEIGASSCIDSGFYLETRTDGSKAEVYDCQTSSGSHQCVTKEGGIARDVTVEAKLLFADTLSSESSKPVCALGG